MVQKIKNTRKKRHLQKKKKKNTYIMSLSGRLHVVVVVVVFFTLTDRALTRPSNIRGCQSGTWSQRLHIEGRLNEGPRLQRKHKDENEAKQNKRNTSKRYESSIMRVSTLTQGDTP